MNLVKYNNNVLKKTAKEFTTPPSKAIIKRMFEIMFSNNGVGLAAPQIGILKQLIIYTDPNNNNGQILVNPKYTKLGDDFIFFEEGCLSFPGISHVVKRHKKILVQAKNQNFEDVEFEAEDLLAIIIQHEIDHLNGITLIDHMDSDQPKAYIKLKKING